jgi:hypothetical protein
MPFKDIATSGEIPAQLSRHLCLAAAAAEIQRAPVVDHLPSISLLTLLNVVA